MSMVSRRIFLKCLGVGSAAVASAALLGGCSGGAASSGSNVSGSGSHNNNSSNSGANNSNSSSSSSSSSSTASSDSTVTSGDIGKGYVYRSMLTCPATKHSKNIAEDQGIQIYLHGYEDDFVMNDNGEKEYIVGRLTFIIHNGSDSIKIPMEHPYADMSFEDFTLFSTMTEVFKGKFQSKYLEASCGSKHIPVAAIATGKGVHAQMLPGQSGSIMMACKLPVNWASFTVKYTLPYDTKKYVNFIVYPSDAMND